MWISGSPVWCWRVGEPRCWHAFRSVLSIGQWDRASMYGNRLSNMIRTRCVGPVGLSGRCHPKREAVQNKAGRDDIQVHVWRKENGWYLCPNIEFPGHGLRGIGYSVPVCRWWQTFCLRHWRGGIRFRLSAGCNGRGNCFAKSGLPVLSSYIFARGQVCHASGFLVERG